MTAPSTRTSRSARNAGVSLVAQIAIIALGFATRSVFIATLGVELVGVNSLLLSVVSMLAFADLGISGALMFALYKPLSEGDTSRAAAVVRYAGRLFRWVALLVAVVGLALTPFVHKLVNLDTDIEHLEIYYLVLLANTVLGYLMLNRTILVNADQKIYLTKAYSIAFNLMRSIAQIVSLLVVGSFLLFLVIQVVFTLANNVTVYWRAGKMYPDVTTSGAELEAAERTSILKSVKAMMLFRLGGLVLHQSPALLISVIVGTAALGYYSNYMLIVSSAVMITEVAFSALTPSVGNLVAHGNHEAARRVFDELVLLSILIHGSIAVGIIVLADNFMELWLGAEFVLPLKVVVGIVLSFYVVGTAMPMWSFRSATGLFRQTQWVMLITACLSIGVSFGLGTKYGLVGVVIAPAVARLISGSWYEPWILIRDHLGGRLWPYFGLQVGALGLWSVVALLIVAIDAQVSTGVAGGFMLKSALALVMLPTTTWVVFHRFAAFKTLQSRAGSLIRRGRKADNRRSA